MPLAGKVKALGVPVDRLEAFAGGIIRSWEAVSCWCLEGEKKVICSYSFG